MNTSLKIQLKEILKRRADEVFKEGVVYEGVIEKCAAFAARVHGDARRALDLLRVAGELAERDGSKKILMKHIDEANNKIEKDKDPAFFTGEIYNFYRDLCLKNNLEVLTQRRVSDMIQEFDMLGLINVRVISKGRGGRMREIKLAMTSTITEKVKSIIEESLDYN